MCVNCIYVYVCVYQRGQEVNDVWQKTGEKNSLVVKVPKKLRQRDYEPRTEQRLLRCVCKCQYEFLKANFLEIFLACVHPVKIKFFDQNLSIFHRGGS